MKRCTLSTTTSVRLALHDRVGQQYDPAVVGQGLDAQFYWPGCEKGQPSTSPPRTIGGHRGCDGRSFVP
jgi:hypothetical protein